MRTIFAPIDFSDSTAGVAAQAGILARALGAQVVLAHVLVPALLGYELVSEAERLLQVERKSAESSLSHWMKQMQLAGVSVDTILLQGPPVPSILAEADQRNSEYIVMGSHGHGALHHLLVGGTTEGVMRKSSCPVVVVPSRKSAETQRPQRSSHI